MYNSFPAKMCIEHDVHCINRDGSPENLWKITLGIAVEMVGFCFFAKFLAALPPWTPSLTNLSLKFFFCREVARSVYDRHTTTIHNCSSYKETFTYLGKKYFLVYTYIKILYVRHHNPLWNTNCTYGQKFTKKEP